MGGSHLWKISLAATWLITDINRMIILTKHHLDLPVDILPTEELLMDCNQLTQSVCFTRESAYPKRCLVDAAENGSIVLYIY